MKLTELNVSLRLHSEFSLSVVALAIALQAGWTNFQNDASRLTLTFGILLIPATSSCLMVTRVHLGGWLMAHIS